MVDGHQGWPEQLCRSGPAALDRLACFYYYYYYCAVWDNKDARFRDKMYWLTAQRRTRWQTQK